MLRSSVCSGSPTRRMLDLRHDGVRIAVILPGSVATEFSHPHRAQENSWMLSLRGRRPGRERPRAVPGPGHSLAPGPAAIPSAEEITGAVSSTL